MFRLLLVGQGFTFLDRFEDCGVDFAGVSFLGFYFFSDLFFTSQKEAESLGAIGLTMKEILYLKENDLRCPAYH